MFKNAAPWIPFKPKAIAQLNQLEVRMLKGFRDFILRGNVVDLAVAVILGAAFNSIFTSLVKVIVTDLSAASGCQPYCC